jgi:4-hydroxythreonine-4-phosphate dehydrogenase
MAVNKKNEKFKPIIGITIGDPASIGSEITAKMLEDKDVYRLCNPIVIGDTDLLKDGLRIAHLDQFLKINSIGSKLEENLTREDIEKNAVFTQGTIDIIDLDNITLDDFEYGKISAVAGKATGEYIKKAIDLSLTGAIDGVVTNALNKEAFTLGGWGKEFPGHTEMFAKYTGTKKYSMMLGHGSLRVFHVTTHIPFKKIADNLNPDRIYDVIELAYNTCRQMGIKEPKIGVAGLNPHSSDNGRFGDEEERIISPAIDMAVRKGIDAVGPVPPDTIGCKAIGGTYSAIVVMYHDLGHSIAKQAGFKLINPETREFVMRGVNATIGLNHGVVRVSVDHGTAYGKAGQGRADHLSLRDALNYAVDLSSGKLMDKEYGARSKK